VEPREGLSGGTLKGLRRKWAEIFSSGESVQIKKHHSITSDSRRAPRKGGRALLDKREQERGRKHLDTMVELGKGCLH